jgi:hypothetical protein
MAAGDRDKAVRCIERGAPKVQVGFFGAAIRQGNRHLCGHPLRAVLESF